MHNNELRTEADKSAFTEYVPSKRIPHHAVEFRCYLSTPAAAYERVRVLQIAEFVALIG